MTSPFNKRIVTGDRLNSTSSAQEVTGELEVCYTSWQYHRSYSLIYMVSFDTSLRSLASRLSMAAFFIRRHSAIQPRPNASDRS
jgi:hypothetical protein